MPLVTYPGGQRERDIYLYWWDKRDGVAGGSRQTFPATKSLFSMDLATQSTPLVWTPNGFHHCKPKFKVCARDTALVQDSSLPTARTGPRTPTFAKRLTSRRET